MLENKIIIVFEGMDGVGKTTMADRIQLKLIETLPVNDFIVHGSLHDTDYLQDRNKFLEDININPIGDMLEITAARARKMDHIRMQLELNKNKKHIFLLDRHNMSTEVYQGQAGVPMEWIFQVNAWVSNGIIPDFIFIIGAEGSHPLNDMYLDKLHLPSVYLIPRGLEGEAQVMLKVMEKLDETDQQFMMREMIDRLEERSR